MAITLPMPFVILDAEMGHGGKMNTLLGEYSEEGALHGLTPFLSLTL